MCKLDNIKSLHLVLLPSWFVMSRVRLARYSCHHHSILDVIECFTKVDTDDRELCAAFCGTRLRPELKEILQIT